MKTLILYFPYEGKIMDYVLGKPHEQEKSTVELTAYFIAKVTGGDLFKISRKEPYPDNLNDYLKIVSDEMKEERIIELDKCLTDVSEYDVIFIGCHLQVGTANYVDRTMVSQLLKLDLSGKTIWPFGDSNVSFTMDYTEEVRRLAPNSTVKNSLWLKTEQPYEDKTYNWLINQSLFHRELNNGVMMPSFGLGTFLLSPKEAYSSVKFALQNGYRLVETANVYANEVSVGKAIRDSGIPREELFISGKLWPTEYSKPFSVKKTLKRLGLDYLDLMFLHHPTKNWRKGYKKLLKAYKQGLIKAIGVSNFEREDLEKLFFEFDIKPHVIQEERHPFLHRGEIRSLIRGSNIALMASYPLGGKGRTHELLNQETIVNIAKKHNMTPAQVVLRWHTQTDFIITPVSQDKEHIIDNYNIFRDALTKQEIEMINALNVDKRRSIAPHKALDQYLHFKPKYEKIEK